MIKHSDLLAGIRHAQRVKDDADHEAAYKAAMAKKPCKPILQTDEYACHCGLRWPKDELPPYCERKPYG